MKSSIFLASVLLAALALPACERNDTTAYDPRIDGLLAQPAPEPDLSILGDQKALHRASPSSSGSSVSATPSASPAPARPGVLEAPREAPPVMAPPDATTAPGGQTAPAPEARPQAAAESPATPAAAVPVDLSSPYSAVRELTLAMLEGDQDRVNRCTLPADGREILTQGPRLSGDQLETARQASRNMMLRQMNVGETMKLSNGKSTTLDANMVSENRMYLAGADPSMPYIVEHKGEDWKVDAGPIIAARKAAIKQ